MGVNRFEDLRVWQAAKVQCDHVGALIKRPEFLGDRPLSDHMNQASISTMNNISEGFVRRRDPETLQFLRYAAASNAEVRTCIYAAEGRHHIGKQEAEQLLERNDGIGKMLRRYMSTLVQGRRPPHQRDSLPAAAQKTPHDRESGPARRPTTED